MKARCSHNSAFVRGRRWPCGIHRIDVSKRQFYTFQTISQDYLPPTEKTVPEMRPLKFPTQNRKAGEIQPKTAWTLHVTRFPVNFHFYAARPWPVARKLAQQKRCASRSLTTFLPLRPSVRVYVINFRYSNMAHGCNATQPSNSEHVSVVWRRPPQSPLARLAVFSS